MTTPIDALHRRYWDADAQPWQKYKNEFATACSSDRAEELMKFGRLMEDQTKPTRETAEWLTAQRELTDIHDLLLRAGR
jgi:hypothetical protein